MKTITIAGPKGGTGKTSTAHALAFEFAAAGYRVTLADCDPQASATQGLGQRAVDNPLSAVPVQIQLDFGRLADRPDHGAGVLWLLPGGRPLATASASQITAHLRRVPLQTDILIVDTVPAIGPITIAAIVAADLVIVPLQPAPYPLSGLVDVLRITAQVSPKARPRALLTLVKARRTMATTIAQQIDRDFPGVLYLARIPDDAQCERAAAACEPVGLFDRHSRSARAYKALTSEVAVDLGLTSIKWGVPRVHWLETVSNVSRNDGFIAEGDHVAQ